jgi:hypothetical protein
MAIACGVAVRTKRRMGQSLPLRIWLLLLFTTALGIGVLLPHVIKRTTSLERFIRTVPEETFQHKDTTAVCLTIGKLEALDIRLQSRPGALCDCRRFPYMRACSV